MPKEKPFRKKRRRLRPTKNASRSNKPGKKNKGLHEEIGFGQKTLDKGNASKENLRKGDKEIGIEVRKGSRMAWKKRVSSEKREGSRSLDMR